MSSFYFEVCKDRLYTAGRDSKDRRGAQTVLHASLGALLATCGPLVPFTAEDIYQYYAVALEDLRIERGVANGGVKRDRLSECKVYDANTVPGFSLFRVLCWHESKETKEMKVQFGKLDSNNNRELWPVLDKFDKSTCIDHGLEAAWKPVGTLRSDVQRVIEVARKEKKSVGSSLEAGIELVGDWQNHANTRAALEAFGDLSEIFVVSQVYFVQQQDEGAAECFSEEGSVVIEDHSGHMEITIRVVRPRGSKCPRCWNFREDIVKVSKVCKRCHEATH